MIQRPHRCSMDDTIQPFTRWRWVTRWSLAVMSSRIPQSQSFSLKLSSPNSSIPCGTGVKSVLGWGMYNTNRTLSLDETVSQTSQSAQMYKKHYQLTLDMTQVRLAISGKGVPHPRSNLITVLSGPRDLGGGRRWCSNWDSIMIAQEVLLRTFKLSLKVTMV